MVFSENNARKKIRISIIDVLIIITVIACIVGTIIHYQIFEKANEVITDDRCRISVLFSELPLQIAERASVGDKVYLSDSSEVLGAVVEVSSKDAVVYYRDGSNKIIEGVDSTKKDVTVIIEVDGEITPDGFLANGTDYTAAGMYIDIFTPKFSGKGLIFDVKKQSE